MTKEKTIHCQLIEHDGITAIIDTISENPLIEIQEFKIPVQELPNMFLQEKGDFFDINVTIHDNEVMYKSVNSNGDKFRELATPKDHFSKLKDTSFFNP